MRRLRGPAGVLVLCALAGACDTTQPPEPGSKTFQVSFAAVNASVPLYNVWDAGFDGQCEGVVAWVPCLVDADCAGQGTGTCLVDGTADDVDRDGTADLAPYCTDTGQPSQPPAGFPLNFATEIAIIRAGQVVEEVLASGLNFEDNLTAYDTNALFGTPRNPQQVDLDGDGTPDVLLIFTNERRHTGGHRDYIEGLTVFGSECLGLLPSLGEPRIADSPPPFSITVNKGDTVVVRARKSNVGSNVPTSSIPQLAAFPMLDGQAVIVQGDVDSESDLGSGFTFSFTVR